MSAAGTAGVVCLHNFTATPEVLRPVAAALARAGHDVDVPLLHGHGAGLERLAASRFADYRRDALDALERVRARCATVVLVGAGAGGLCALHLAAERDDVAGVAVVAAPTGPFDPRLVERARDLLRRGVEVTPPAAPAGGRPAPGGAPALAGGMPLRAYLSLHEAALALDPGRIGCPVLAIYPRTDATLVDPGAHVARLRDEVAGPVEALWLDEGGHYATAGPEAGRIARLVRRFAGDCAPPVPGARP